MPAGGSGGRVEAGEARDGRGLRVEGAAGGGCGGRGELARRQVRVSFLNTRISCMPMLMGLCLAALPCHAGSIVNIFDGITEIGSLSSSVDSSGNESAAFTLFGPYRYLMSDAAGTQFRFFQVIYYDDEPTTWLGNIITPAGAPAHSGTVVDTPSGGWDYELPGGDDTAPFYESDTEDNPSTGKPYAFPTLSYPDLHSPDGTNPGTVSSEDAPGLSAPSHQTLFETFLAYSNPALRALQEFDVLGGYSWGVSTDGSGYESGIDTTGISFSSIDSGTLAELQAALNRSGFGPSNSNAWTIETNANFATLAPEPSTLLLGAVGVLLIVARARGTRRGFRYEMPGRPAFQPAADRGSALLHTHAHHRHAAGAAQGLE